MARFRRHLSLSAFENAEDGGIYLSEKKRGLNVSRLLCVSVLFFFVLSSLLTLIYDSVSKDSHRGRFQFLQPRNNVDSIVKEEDVLRGQNKEINESEEYLKEEDQVPTVIVQAPFDHGNETFGSRGFEGESGPLIKQELQGTSSLENADDKEALLDGLLAHGFNRNSCQSRHHANRYRKASRYKPSDYLIERLRKYEDLHRRCGPYTNNFNKSLNRLKSGKNPGNADCQYIVWIAYSGLGNRIVTIASTFLYALLTNRVLLIDRGADMRDLFCEPFPNTTWLLPLDFPIQWLQECNETSIHRYGHLLSHNVIQAHENGTRSSLPHFIYVHLTHTYDFHDKLFFCEREQRFLEKMPWLLLKSNNYFVPSLYLLSLFGEELHRLFPTKDSVFHHLGRYLFHPSNAAWGLITRFYQAYLAHAEQRIGIQIRTFDPASQTISYMSEQVWTCALKNNLLPNISVNDKVPEDTDTNGDVRKPKVVLVTSLNFEYSEIIRRIYWEHPTVDGQLVSVYQPSHEEWQQTDKKSHNMKAWAEMYLLSLSDVLVTSHRSTFGYVAQGLRGIKPWIMFKPANGTVPNPPCQQAMSMEPCFHSPPFYDCKSRKVIDTGKVFPYVKHCEDVRWGLKLVENEEL